MKYQEYFDSQNDILCALHDDTITSLDALKQITELNVKALNSGNLVLVKFLSDPQEQVNRIVAARTFEATQAQNEAVSTSYKQEQPEETSYSPEPEEEEEEEESYSYSYDEEYDEDGEDEKE